MSARRRKWLFFSRLKMNEMSEREMRFKEDPRSTDEVIALALTKNADSDGDDYWNWIWVIQARLPVIFDKVKELASNANPASRDLAATVLGQNGLKDKVASQQCVSLLTSMLLKEQSSKVLVLIIFALGHHHNSSCLPSLLNFESHPDADVRYALTHSLGGMEEDAAVEALCRLSYDPDTGIRSWATFGIGTLTNRKTELIHNGLVARLEDKDDEVRGEALVGLTERCETCVVSAFMQELDRSSSETLRSWTLIQDAAAAVQKCHTANPRAEWEPILARLKKIGIPSSETK
jgi:HEAT repeat protein